MRIDLAISTRNRSAYLRRALESFTGQTLDNEEDSYQIVVVDNNSTDDTQQVVTEFRKTSLAPVECIFEKRPGLSFARNAAIEKSQADVIVFMDDDAYADRGWLNALVKVYRETNAACVGGKIKLEWEAPRPDWLSDRLLYYLAHLDYGDQTVLLSNYKLIPYGANISFRKSILDKVGKFETTLGRTGEIMLDSEEVELCYRIRKAGGEIWYTPGARVFHTVSSKRLKKEYFLNSSYWKGRSGARLSLHRDGYLKTILRAIKRGIKLPIDLVVSKALTVWGSQAVSFYHTCESKIDYGFLIEFITGHPLQDNIL